MVNLFNFMFELKKITKPIRMIEYFAGYGSQALALKYLGVKFESWKICEWAIPSIQAYKDIHCPNDNTDYSKGLTYREVIEYLSKKGISRDYSEPLSLKDIARMSEDKVRTIYNNIIATHNLVSVTQVHAKDLEIVDTDKYEYIMSYSFPCQDLSVAGKGKGCAKGSGTRSGMLWEVERVLKECDELPQVLIMENVSEIHNKNHVKDFALWIDTLEQLGYSNYYEDLNAQDYGVPQRRIRTFMVSILGNYKYEFPTRIPLKDTMRSLLERNVDEKYYLTGQNLEYVLDAHDVALKGNRDINKAKVNPKIAKTISCRGAVDQRADVTNFIIDDCEEEVTVASLKERLCTKLIREGKVKPYDVIRHSYTNNRLNNGEKNMSRIENHDSLCPTLDTRCDCLGVVVPSVTPKLVGGIGDKKSNGGRQWYQQDRVYDSNGVAMCHPANLPSGSYNYLLEDLRIRKLTPRECFRLQGVKDEDFDNVSKHQSDIKLYHLAGDSIATVVLMAIFGKLLGIKWQDKLWEIKNDD